MCVLDNMRLSATIQMKSSAAPDKPNEKYSK